MKIFSTLLFAIAILLSAQNADAAKCKYQENSKDKFTRVLTQWTKWNPQMNTFTMAFRDHSLFISAFSVGGEAQLRVKIDTFIQKKHAPAAKEVFDYIVVPESAPLLITMEDETITELLADEEVRTRAYTVAPGDPGSTADMYHTRAITIIKYALDAETIEALTSQPATKLRITT